MEVNDITKEMFVAWKHDPVTKSVLIGIDKERDKIKEAMAQGAYGNDFNELNKAIGYCIGLAQFDNIQFQEDINDEDSPSGMASNS